MKEDDYLQKYLERVLDVENQLRTSQDKLVVTLSSGALGVSLGFVHDIVDLVDANHLYLLKLSWAVFILALGSVVMGVQFGVLAHRKTQNQIADKSIYTGDPGGVWGKLTTWLQNSGPLLLLAGFCLFALFVSLNI